MLELFGFAAFALGALATAAVWLAFARSPEPSPTSPVTPDFGVVNECLMQFNMEWADFPTRTKRLKYCYLAGTAAR